MMQLNNLISSIHVRLFIFIALVSLCCFVTGLLVLRRRRIKTWISRFYARWIGLFLGVIGSLVLLFGLVGFSYREGGELNSLASAAYATAQLFSLNTPLEELEVETDADFERDFERHNPAVRENVPADAKRQIDGLDDGKRISLPYLILAKLFATLFVVAIATQAIGSLFQDSYLKLQLRFATDHIVVCGLGRIGRQLISDLIARRDSRTIVLIEPDTKNRQLSWAREEGVLVVLGDATHAGALEEARVEHASELFIVTGNDENNIECVVELRDFLQKNPVRRVRWNPFRRTSPNLRVRVHILNRDLAEILRMRATDLEQSSQQVDIEVFNALERTARRLLEELVVATPVQSSIRPVNQDEVAHYVILGFGEFGQTLALQLAELAHFENRQRLRLTILEHRIDEVARPFLARYPAFAPEYGTCGPWIFSAEADCWDSKKLRPGAAARSPAKNSIEYVCNAGFQELCEVTDDQFIENLNAAFSQSGVRPAILVCFEEDRKNFALAERLKSKLRTAEKDWPIFVWIPRQRELAQLLIEKRRMQIRHAQSEVQERELIPFGECNGSVAYQEVTCSWTEWLARHLELSYQHQYGSQGETNPLSLAWQTRETAFREAKSGNVPQFPAVDWATLDAGAFRTWSELTSEAFRISNRSAANHSVVKLAVLNRRIVGQDLQSTPESVSIPVGDETNLTLRTMEHYRWVAERLLAGWRFGETKDKKRKRHPQLIPWEALTPDEQMKDETSVELLLGLCRLGKLKTESTMKSDCSSEMISSTEMMSNRERPAST